MLPLEEWLIQVMLALPLPYEVARTKGRELFLQARNEEGLTIIWEYKPELTTFAMRDTYGQVFSGEGLNPKEAFANKELSKPMTFN